VSFLMCAMFAAMLLIYGHTLYTSKLLIAYRDHPQTTRRMP